MSGPSLKQLHAHRAIHEGAYAEAKELTDVLGILMQRAADQEHILEVADALLEHWETRTLAHAQSEEEGFYLEKLQQDASLLETVTRLKRDHELMGIIAVEIKDLLGKEGVTDAVLERFKTLLILVRIHSRQEEQYLL